MYSSSPVTMLLSVAPLLIVKVVTDPAKPFFLKNSLNPLIFPRLAIPDGNCHDAVMLVEELAVKVKLLGACDGTETKDIEMHALDNLLIINLDWITVFNNLVNFSIVIREDASFSLLLLHDIV